MSYKLMEKIQNVTKLKYLCITSTENWKSYPGSGRKWRNHLDIYGYDFSTTLLFESDDYDIFVEECIKISDLLDVANSEEYANAIPESGYDNRSGKCNFIIWWDAASEETKADVYKRRAISIKKNHWSTKEFNRLYVCTKISEKRREFFKNMNSDDLKVYMEKFNEGRRRFQEDKNSEKYLAYRRKLSESAIKRLAETPKEVLSSRARTQRLNTSPESAQRRKEKIQAVYATGKHDALFKQMSEDRMKTGNPNATIIYWEGQEYIKQDFLKFLRNNNISKVEALDLIEIGDNEHYYVKRTGMNKTYEILICPYCGVESGGKKPGPFKRWHFENCKHKKL